MCIPVLTRTTPPKKSLTYLRHLSRQSHTLCHVPCLCPESCAFSPVALSHLPMTRRHSQTESPVGDRLLRLLHVPHRVCGDVVHQLLQVGQMHCTTVARVRASVRALRVTWLRVSPALPLPCMPHLAPASNHPAPRVQDPLSSTSLRAKQHWFLRQAAWSGGRVCTDLKHVTSSTGIRVPVFLSSM